MVWKMKKDSKQNITILGINGSPSKKGRTAKLLEKVMKGAEKNGAKTKLIHLVDVEHLFFHSYLSKKPEKDLSKLLNELVKADGFILASPVNWMNVSVLMKNFIDKLTALEERGFLLEGKVAGFVAFENEGGGWETVLDMLAPLNHMGVLTPPYSLMFYNPRLSKQKISRWMDKDLELLGKNIVVMIEMIKKTKPNFGYGKKFFRLL